MNRLSSFFLVFLLSGCGARAVAVDDDQAAALSAELAALQDRVEDLEQLQQRVATLEGLVARVEALEAAVDAIQPGTTNDLEERVDELEERVDDMESATNSPTIEVWSWQESSPEGGEDAYEWTAIGTSQEVTIPDSGTLTVWCAALYYTISTSEYDDPYPDFRVSLEQGGETQSSGTLLTDEVRVADTWSAVATFPVSSGTATVSCEGQLGIWAFVQGFAIFAPSSAP